MHLSLLKTSIPTSFMRQVLLVAKEEVVLEGLPHQPISLQFWPKGKDEMR
jgi:hypothetical protein